MQDAVFAFESGAATHVGAVRPLNEDHFLVRPDNGIWAVADGMGGHEAGDVASATVIEALDSIDAPRSAADLIARCEESIANVTNRLMDIGSARGGITMGTTLAALLAYDRQYACIWAGDSRIYRVRDSAIVQLSRDHTEVEEFVASGALTRDEARTWPRRNVITRAIGSHGEVELDLERGSLEPGDIFVICSDGLTACVADEEIRDHVAANTPQAACDALIALALEREVVDNVTVIVVRYRPGSFPVEGTAAGYHTKGSSADD
jgi:protein phosphatase